MSIRTLFALISLSLTSLSQAEVLTDPTRPAGYSSPIIQDNTPTDNTAGTAVKEWTLNTTLVSPYQRLAMINGKRVEIGDQINGAELISIDHQKVQLRIDGKLITVKLYNSFISNISPN